MSVCTHNSGAHNWARDRIISIDQREATKIISFKHLRAAVTALSSAPYRVLCTQCRRTRAAYTLHCRYSQYTQSDFVASSSRYDHMRVEKKQHYLAARLRHMLLSSVRPHPNGPGAHSTQMLEIIMHVYARAAYHQHICGCINSRLTLLRTRFSTHIIYYVINA